MKRSNTRDISSFFTKKSTTKNASQVQTSEENPIPEINITRAPQPSAQGSSPSVTITHLLMSFDFVFVAHLMVAIFGITNELNVALQKHDQDIVNAMSMVDITKTSLQKMRDEVWNLHMDKVTSFMVKYGVEVPNMEANYIVPGRRMYRVGVDSSGCNSKC
ncbi:hypothetical protein POM88_034598 [Heracleum sosnowskyi]|uniref:Uncharacterized protein n=1 Tax=Heracleum sosnowskyi TaxID=360622 RepID=A0AAD8MCF2_9APIA|nr:hypothetical protein POM88_034598 [Heracleum sosnowskyi]